MDLLDRFVQECRERTYWSSSDRIVIAVSGGVDSMVLFDLAVRLPEDLRPDIVVAHVNHQLRAESDKEEEAVRKLIEEKKLPFFSTKWPIDQHPQSGTEEGARLFRYSFLEQVMKKTNSGYLATAHHRGDQFETLLMRFVRGGQMERMTGIRRIRPFGEGELVRPLLSFSKEELYAYANSRYLLYFEDASNKELKYTRNRYRHTIIPLLKQENPSAEEHAEQFAQDMEDALHLIEPLVSQSVDAVKVSAEQVPTISRSAFLALDNSLQRFVMSRLLQEAYEETGEVFKRRHVMQIVRWMQEGRPNSRIDLPGKLSMIRSYDSIRFEQKEKSSSSEKREYEVNLSLGTWVKLPDHSRIGLVSSEDIHNDKPISYQQRIYLDPGQIELPLTIRNRKPGDRMTLKGMQRGSKKLKDIFIDQKVPAKDRDEALVVTDAVGEIIWLIKFKESSLSIEPETDTIQYILIYEPYMSQSIKGE